MKTTIVTDALVMCVEDVPDHSTPFTKIHAEDTNGVYGQLYCFNRQLASRFKEDRSYRFVLSRNDKNGRVYLNVVGASEK